MIEVNLIGENTDLTHVKELFNSNMSETDTEYLSSLISILFDSDMDDESKENALEELVAESDSTSEVDVSEAEISETIAGMSQLQMLLPTEFEHMKVVFDYIVSDSASLEEAEVAQESVRNGEMDEFSINIPQEDEGASRMML